jgi:glutathione peroxidase
MTSIYDFKVQDIHTNEVSLADYRDKVLLIVNTASQCGFTPQYKGLEELYQQYKDQGLEILGFPCNQFGRQEPGDEKRIQQFCELNYGVSFPLHSKIDVNGKSAHPLYDYLKDQARGILGSRKIKWNFTKFLINRDGEVVKRYAPKDTPESIARDIEALL